MSDAVPKTSKITAMPSATPMARLLGKRRPTVAGRAAEPTPELMRGTGRGRAFWPHVSSECIDVTLIGTTELIAACADERSRPQRGRSVRRPRRPCQAPTSAPQELYGFRR
jgi:hypothetical protein